MRNKLKVICLLGLTSAGVTSNVCFAQNQRPAIFDESPSVEFLMTSEKLTNNYADWKSRELGLRLPMSDNGLLDLRTGEFDRFSKRDQLISLGYARFLGAGTATLELGRTSNADFLPERSYALGWNLTGPSGWGYLVKGRYRSYTDVISRELGIGIEKYLKDVYLLYEASRATLDGGKSFWVNKVRSDWNLSEKWILSFTHSRGDEGTTISPGVTQKTPIKFTQLGGSIKHNSYQIALSAWKAEQGAYYDRDGVQIAFRLAF